METACEHPCFAAIRRTFVIPIAAIVRVTRLGLSLKFSPQEAVKNFLGILQSLHAFSVLRNVGYGPFQEFDVFLTVGGIWVEKGRFRSNARRTLGGIGQQPSKIGRIEYDGRNTGPRKRCVFEGTTTCHLTVHVLTNCLSLMMNCSPQALIPSGEVFEFSDEFNINILLNAIPIQVLIAHSPSASCTPRRKNSQLSERNPLRTKYP